MVSINKDLSRLTAQFEHIRKEVNKSPLLSTKSNAEIEKLGEKILQKKAKLESKIETLSDKGTNIKIVDKLHLQLKQLKELGKQIDEFQSQLPLAFQAKETRNIIKRIFSSSFGAIAKTLTRPIRLQIFAGGNSKIKSKAVNNKLNEIEKKLMKISQKEAKLNNELVKLEKSIIKPISLSQNKINKIKGKIEIIEKSIETLHSKYNQLNTTRVNPLEIVNKNESNFQTSERMRNSCKILGGERVTLTTADKVKLDSVYLDAVRFRNKLANAGCELVKLKTSDSDTKTNALFISEDNFQKSGKEIFNALKELHAFADPNLENYDPGAGWQIVHNSDGILIINESELSLIKEHPFIEFSESEKRWEIRKESYNNLEYEKTPIDTQAPASGTAIVTSGNSGVYEMHKNEAAFYLLRNMNVMLFNFRGYGESEGSPTQRGMKLDIESAYQFVKARSKHEDKQIVFKSLCMSGAFASYMAAKHPKTNIILDQSFSDFTKVLKEQVSADKYKNIPQSLKNIVANLIAYLSFDINIAKNLAKNEGKIGIVLSQQDQLMKMSHVEENMEAISKVGKLGNVTLMQIPGSHATPVIRSKAPQDAFEQNVGETLREAYKRSYNEFEEINNKLNKLYEKRSESSNKEELVSIQEDIKIARDRFNRVMESLEQYKKKIKKLNEGSEAVGQTQIDRFLRKANLGHSLF